ncbi:MAG: hypothetical protein ABIS26_00385 [Candidatus Paceibacterota bacterium]
MVKKQEELTPEERASVESAIVRSINELRDVNVDPLHALKISLRKSASAERIRLEEIPAWYESILTKMIVESCEKAREKAVSLPRELSLIGRVHPVGAEIVDGKIIRRSSTKEHVLRPENFRDLREQQLPPRDRSDAD